LHELKGTRILQAVLSLTIGCKISAVIAWRRLEAMLALGKVESLVTESSLRCAILGNNITDSIHQSRKSSRNQNFSRLEAVDKASSIKHTPQQLENSHGHPIYFRHPNKLEIPAGTLTLTLIT
jgi:hypothetical protein